MSERWKPTRGEKYWAISFDNIWESVWQDHIVDNGRWLNYQCFKTQAEAQAAAEQVKALLFSLHRPITDGSKPTTDCNQLPKLTTDVFGREDCPEWARYAVVNSKGTLIFFGNKPTFEGEDYGCWSCSSCPYKHIRGVVFDASDWENSLIERPARLPEWCKNGALAWENGDYFELEVIDEDHQITMKYSDGTEESVIADYIGKHVKQARLRPYNADEMKALVGKVIVGEDEISVITDYSRDNDNIYFIGGWSSADEILKGGYTINGKPCGVLEHLENGEWVE